MPTLLQRERLILPTARRLILDLDGNDTSTLWQASTFTTAVTTTADPVGGWQDKSGCGNHFTQGTVARKPTWNSSSINGLGGVAFAGASAQLLTRAGLPSPGTLILVTRVTSGAGSRILFMPGNAGGLWALTLDGAQRWTMNLGQSGTINASNPANPSNHVVVVRAQGNEYSSLVSVDGSAGWARLSKGKVGTASMGADPDTTTDYTGEHARVLYFDGLLTNAEINAWLSTLYGTFAISGSYLK